MVIAWPLLLLIAVGVAWSRRGTADGRGWTWFLGWMAAGVLWSFSLITGFSVGLLVLPIAAVALLWMATRAPHLAEASGFVVGIATTAVLIDAINS
jgi:hypothetical protein